MKRYKYIAKRFDAMKNCSKNKNYEWYYEHLEKIKNTLEDMNIVFDIVRSKIDYLVFSSEKYVCDDNGHELGYFPYNIILTPSFVFDFEIKITGQFSLWKLTNSGIKDSIYEEIDNYFSKEVEYK